ncbi:MAG TPA: hypothetical protein VGW38_26090 [Chloroflexota bacterium]|nr:hypothetical protein [Chloroflexota bacterium]
MVIDQLAGGEIGRFQEALIEANYPRTTNHFVNLLKDGYRMPDLVRHGLDAASPYLTVPSHVMVNDAGEMSNVNYDHCVLGLRASRRMMPYLPEAHRQLSMAQAIWYMPQGLDVWDQLLCEFPGHYARDDKKCGVRPGGTDEQGNDRFDGPAWSAPKQWFQTDHEPDREGSVQERLIRMQNRIMEGDKNGAYKLSLGLRREPDPTVRKQLESQLLFCAIIDLQDTLQQRKLQNIGHKALRARAVVELSDLVGYEHADNLYYCVVPDIACFPRLYPLYDYSTLALGGRFKGEMYALKRANDQPLTDEERETFIDLILNAKQPQVLAHITHLLGQGKRIIEISDTVIAAFNRHLNDEVWSKKSFFQIGHAFDYANVVNFWLRSYEHPHQAKGPYFQAAFVNDCIQMTKAFPIDVNSEFYLGDWKAHRDWASRLSIADCLGQIIAACERLDMPRARACTESYLERESARRPLMEALTIASAKFQNDPHIQRHAATMIEEYENTTLPERYKDDFLRAWATYVAGGAKRTTALDCVRMYEGQLGVSSSVIFTPNSRQHDIGVMGMTLAKPVETD